MMAIPLCSAHPVQFGGFVRFDIRAGGIVGMYHQHRTTLDVGRLRAPDRRSQRLKIDLPAMVVHQFVRHELDVVEIRQKIE